MERRRGNGLRWAALAVLSALATPGGAEGQTVPALREHRWKHRLVVVLAPDSTLAAYRTQMAELARHREALTVRDVRVMPALADDARRWPSTSCCRPSTACRWVRRKRGDVPGAEPRARAGAAAHVSGLSPQ
jgi:hypothetical protein